MHYALMATKLLIGIICLIAVIRILGKKELAEASPLDVVYAVALGDLVGDAAYDPKIKIGEIIFTVAVWTVFIYILDRAAKRFDWFSRLTKGKAEVLILDGELHEEVMKRNRMDREEVNSLLRQSQIFDVKEVKIGVLEVNGQLTVMPYKR